MLFHTQYSDYRKGVGADETTGEKFTIDLTLILGICFYKRLQVFV